MQRSSAVAAAAHNLNEHFPDKLLWKLGLGLLYVVVQVAAACVLCDNVQLPLRGHADVERWN